MSNKNESKALEFIYQDTEIHFLLGNDKDVMVNATEMAKAFGKRIEDFKRLDGTKLFIKELLEHENAKFVHADVREQNIKMLEENDIINTTNRATYMHRKLALKFAVWLDVKFELWIIDTIDKFLFGYYKEHMIAHLIQVDAKERMEAARKKLLLNANQEDVIAYFRAEAEFNTAKNDKSKAIRNQLSFFEQS